MQIALRHRRVVVRAGAKERAVAIDEVRERIRDTLDQRSVQRSQAHTVTRRIDGFTSPLPALMSWRPIDSTYGSNVKGQFEGAQLRARSFATIPQPPIKEGKVTLSN
jgi:hypothetical protein